MMLLCAARFYGSHTFNFRYTEVADQTLHLDAFYVVLLVPLELVAWTRPDLTGRVNVLSTRNCH